MRSAFLIALIVPFAGCSTTSPDAHPYAMPNSLMRREIQTRISEFPLQHGQELLNNMLWLQTKAGETAIVDLLAALDHEDPKVRCSATWVLGRIHDRRVVPSLRPLTADKSEVVRLEAARSLVNMGDLQYVTILIEGLDSDKPSVRYNCHMALKDSTGRDFQYDHLEEDDGLRCSTVLRWREWWASQSEDPWFAASYARTHGLSSATLEQVSAPNGETKSPSPAAPNTTSNTEVPGATKPGSVTPETQTGANPWSPIRTAPPKSTTPAAKTPAGEAPTGKTPTGKTTGVETPGTETTPNAGTTGAKTEGAETDTPVFKLLDVGPPAEESKAGKSATDGKPTTDGKLATDGTPATDGKHDPATRVSTEIKPATGDVGADPKTTEKTTSGETGANPTESKKASTDAGKVETPAEQTEKTGKDPATTGKR